MLKMDENGKLCTDSLSEVATPFTSIPRTKKGKVRFHAFANTLGSVNKANIITKAGFVKVDVNSQFWKMLRHKENRASVLMNIKDTLKDPLLVAKDGDSVFFFNSFKKKNGNLFNMVSVCSTANADGELVLMTNYQLKRTTKIEQFLKNERGEIIYKKREKKVIHINRNKIKM